MKLGDLQTNTGLTITTQKIRQAASIPVAGTWLLGDIVLHTDPAIGDPTGWICTTAGTPGTWSIISVAGSGTDVTLAAVGATPNANAATLTGQVLNLQPADGTYGGIVTTGSQTFGGAKTFIHDMHSNTSAGYNAYSILDGARINFSTADASAYLSRSASNTITAAGDFTTIGGLASGTTLSAGSGGIYNTNGNYFGGSAGVVLSFNGRNVLDAVTNPDVTIRSHIVRTAGDIFRVSNETTSLINVNYQGDITLKSGAITSTVANGASAVGLTLTTQAMSTAGSYVAKFVNGTETVFGIYQGPMIGSCIPYVPKIGGSSIAAMRIGDTFLTQYGGATSWGLKIGTNTLLGDAWITAGQYNSGPDNDTVYDYHGIHVVGTYPAGIENTKVYAGYSMGVPIIGSGSAGAASGRGVMVGVAATTPDAAFPVFSICNKLSNSSGYSAAIVPGAEPTFLMTMRGSGTLESYKASGGDALKLLDGAAINFSTSDSNAKLSRVTNDIIETPGSFSAVTGLILPKTSGVGIKVERASPTFPWKDLIGDVSPKTTGVGAATLAVFRGGSYRAWFYGAGDLCDMVFHVPHDYAPGTDLHLHLHWAHNGTAISGSLVVTFGVSVAKGHNQANFTAEVAPVITISTPDVATIPQYRHRIDEIQISAASPGATQFNTDLLEPDAILLVSLTATTIPTITGGSTNKPAFITCDIHYQSTGIGTKAKAPNFYT